jgi:formylglycine-generating enzyme required for sulfatase activity
VGDAHPTGFTAVIFGGLSPPKITAGLATLQLLAIGGGRFMRTIPIISVLVISLILPYFILPSVSVSGDFGIKRREPKQQRAFLVGVGDYEDSNITPLKSPANDIKEFREALIQFCGFKAENVVMITNEENGDGQPTSTDILLSLKKFVKQVKRRDTVLFYFVGYGLTINDQSFLLAYDASAEIMSSQEPFLLDRSMVPLEKVKGILSTIRAHQTVLIFNAFRNSPITSRGDDNNLLTEAFVRETEVPSATAVLHACSPGQRGWEMPTKPGEEHSVFGYYLLEGLREEAKKPDGTVTFSSLATYTEQKVAKWADEHNKPAQTPMYERQDDEEVVLAKSPSSEPRQLIHLYDTPTVATLFVISEPKGATVYLEDDRLETTPLMHQVETEHQGEKKVRVRLELTGYKPIEVQKTLRGGEKTDVHLTLDIQPDPSLLRFITNEVDSAPMRLIDAGTFQMGSPFGEFSDATPSHSVYLDAFYIDQYEVTNEQFRAFVLANPQWGKEKILERYHDGGYLKHWTGNTYPQGLGSHPVVYVSWYAAVAYAAWAGKTLPTEAQWERAARGELTGAKYPWGNAFPDRTRGNFGRNVGSMTPVGQYTPNDFGLYDMVGNVWEWCMDEYHPFYELYEDALPQNPLAGERILSIEDVSPNVVAYRVYRGGAWDTHGNLLDVAFRKRSYPDATITRDNIGFRCVKN